MLTSHPPFFPLVFTQTNPTQSSAAYFNLPSHLHLPEHHTQGQQETKLQPGAEKPTGDGNGACQAKGRCPRNVISGVTQLICTFSGYILQIWTNLSCVNHPFAGSVYDHLTPALKSSNPTVPCPLLQPFTFFPPT